MIRRVYQFLHIADVMVDAFSEIGFGPRPGAVAAALATGNSDIPCRAELVVGGVADGQVPRNGHPRLRGARSALLYHEDLRRLLAGARRALTSATVVDAVLPISNGKSVR